MKNIFKFTLTAVIAANIIALPTLAEAQVVDNQNQAIDHVAVTQQVKELFALEKEIISLKKELQEAKNAREIGTDIALAIGVGTITLRLMGEGFKAIATPFGQVFWGMAGLRVPDYKFQVPVKSLALGLSSAAVGGVWYYIKSEDVSKLQKSLDEAELACRNIREALETTLK